MPYYEQVFYFGEHARWCFCFEGPNAAGAFFAMLAAFAIPVSGFFARKNKVAAIAAISIELILWAIIAKTYSRGALAAVVACIAIGFFTDAASGLKVRKAAAFMFGRLALLFAAVFICGFHARIAPKYLSSDASVASRMELWKGGLKMAAANPIVGWGIDESGNEYMNWFQGDYDGRKYAGMVNSYLHIGVERGLPVVFAALFVISGFIFLGGRKFFGGKKFDSALCGGCAMLLVAFLIVNIFSTLWIFKKLWILPVASMLAIALCAWPNSSERKNAALFSSLSAAILSLAVSMGIFVAGSLLTGDIKIFKSDGLIKIRASARQENPLKILIIPDPEIFGEPYGKAVKRMFPDMKTGKYEIDVLPPENTNANGFQGYLSIIAAGSKAKLLEGMKTSWQNVFLLNPMGKNAEKLRDIKSIKIVFPSMDIHGQSKYWRTASSKYGWSFEYFDSPSFADFEKVPHIKLSEDGRIQLLPPEADNCKNAP